jgi:CubicO group peptidase (beta-lactamase class C family)
MRSTTFLRTVLAIAILGTLSTCTARNADVPDSARVSPTNGWVLSAPEEQGVDSQALIDGYQGIVDKGVNVHAMLVVRNGRLVSEAYFYPYSAEDAVNIHSCTKSVLSALVGIAIKEGSLRSVDQKVLEFFTGVPIQNMSAQKQKITIRHLLTMSPGLAVRHPDDDMKASTDWVRHVLDLPMAEEPGSRFNYSDATAHLLSAVLQKATGMSAMDYATSRLFEPMGITASWPSDPQGVSMGFSEINMTPRDMAKIGLLYLNKGMWDGRQLVPSAWIAESTTRKIATGGGDDYGYLWWCPEGSYQARGAGEQYIVVAPSMNVVAVITNGLAAAEAVDLGTAASVIKGASLPANPDAVLRLRARERQLQEPRAAQAALGHSVTAARVSGRVYEFSRDSNPLNLKELSVDFGDPGPVVVLGRDFEGHELRIPLPADGRYQKDASRTAANDTVFRRGYWKDSSTFVVRTEKSQFEELALLFEGKTLTLRYSIRGVPVFDKLKGREAGERL